MLSLPSLLLFAATAQAAGGEAVAISQEAVLPTTVAVGAMRIQAMVSPSRSCSTAVATWLTVEAPISSPRARVSSAVMCSTVRQRSGSSWS